MNNKFFNFASDREYGKKKWKFFGFENSKIYKKNEEMIWSPIRWPKYTSVRIVGNGFRYPSEHISSGNTKKEFRTTDIIIAAKPVGCRNQQVKRKKTATIQNYKVNVCEIIAITNQKGGVGYGKRERLG